MNKTQRGKWNFAIGKMYKKDKERGYLLLKNSNTAKTNLANGQARKVLEALQMGTSMNNKFANRLLVAGTKTRKWHMNQTRKEFNERSYNKFKTRGRSLIKAAWLKLIKKKENEGLSRPAAMKEVVREYGSLQNIQNTAHYTQRLYTSNLGNRIGANHGSLRRWNYNKRRPYMWPKGYLPKNKRGK